MAI
ncbi:hypothetical protein D047_1325A, partial [Vibrio parahaemolyticus VPTS-2010_2]|jgi:hypothetical protein|eukprot:gene17746-23344_t